MCFASRGRCSDSCTPGSDVANLAVLGYDPIKYYNGRGPLEAMSMGIKLGSDDVAFRCNLITVRDGLIADYSAGHVTSGEAAELINYVDREMGGNGTRFYPGISYRHLMVWNGGEYKADCTPPHDITGKELSNHLPSGVGADFLLELMKESAALLESHQVNRDRIAGGKLPANSIWLWGQGKRPVMPTFRVQYGEEVVSAMLAS